jgi:hypothetical protein
MKCPTFLLWIAGTYSLYYLAIILKDIARCRGSPPDQLAAKEPGLSASQQELKAGTKTINANLRLPEQIPAILAAIRSYDNAGHKTMVHARFDAKTLQTMKHLKMATGIDMTRLIAFSVSELLRLHPELKAIIKQFHQNPDE